MTDIPIPGALRISEMTDLSEPQRQEIIAIAGDFRTTARGHSALIASAKRHAERDRQRPSALPLPPHWDEPLPF